MSEDVREEASTNAKRRLVYTFYACGCATGLCLRSGFLVEAHYCSTAAEVGLRAEGYGKRLAGAEADGTTVRTTRSKRQSEALYLLMARAIKRLEAHRHRAGIERGPLVREPGLLAPPGQEL